jgi:CDP-6-deoxy-D-xylo-4-hexulose-3-dehydrase
MPLLPASLEERERTFRRIQSSIDGNDAFLPVLFDHLERIPAFAIPLVCKDAETRSRVIRAFDDAGIETRPLIAGNMQEQPFYSKYNMKKYPVDGTSILHSQGLYITNQPGLTEEELLFIEHAIQSI